MKPDLIDSLLDFATFAKIALVLAAAPVWWPILKVFWREMDDALAPEGGFLGVRRPRDVPRRPAGLDPWRNEPLARRGAGRAPAGTGRPTSARRTF